MGEYCSLTANTTHNGHLRRRLTCTHNGHLRRRLNLLGRRVRLPFCILRDSASYLRRRLDTDTYFSLRRKDEAQNIAQNRGRLPKTVKPAVQERVMGL